MKKVTLTLALAAMFPSWSYADFTLYGKGNVSLHHADEQLNGDKVELVSNSSRIGIKGSEVINEGLTAVYQFEYQTEVDDGSNASGTFSQRNIFIGLEGQFGRVIGGLFDTPLKVVQEKVDLFNDLVGDITQVLNGEIRAKNIVQYSAPKSLGNFGASVAYVTQEADGADDGVSASVTYTNDNFYAGVALDQDVIPGVDSQRLAARYTLASVQLGALYERYDNGTIDEDGVIVSALWSLNKSWGLKAQYGESDIKAPGSSTASLGADYKLSKNVTLFSYFTQVENDTTRDDQYLGVGLDVKF